MKKFLIAFIVQVLFTFFASLMFLLILIMRLLVPGTKYLVSLYEWTKRG